MTGVGHCEICGDESTISICPDCQREEEIREAADNSLSSFRILVDTEARLQLEFVMTKCALCDEYYGPFSMEKHLREDHSIESPKVRRKTINDSYWEGYEDGHEDRDPNQEYS